MNKYMHNGYYFWKNQHNLQKLYDYVRFCSEICAIVVLSRW